MELIENLKTKNYDDFNIERTISYNKQLTKILKTIGTLREKSFLPKKVCHPNSVKLKLSAADNKL